MKLRSIIQYLIFLGLGLVILYFLYQSQQEAYYEECQLKGIALADCSLLDRILADFASAKWIWIVIVSAVFMFSNVLRGLRWKQIFAAENYNISLFNSVGILLVGYFANLGLPRVGEIIKMGMMSKYENISFEKVAASVVIDRIMDIICLLAVIVLSIILAKDVFWNFLQENLQLSTLKALAISAFLFGIIFILALFWIRRLDKNQNISSKRLQWAVAKVKSFGESLLSVRNIKNIPLFILYSVGIWVCYFFMTYWCFFAFEPVSHLTAKAGLVVFLFGTLGMVFPSPGGMGSYHFLVIQALLLFSINSVDANSFAYIIFFSINIFCNVFFGILFLLILPVYNQKYRSSPSI